MHQVFTTYKEELGNINGTRGLVRLVVEEREGNELNIKSALLHLQTGLPVNAPNIKKYVIRSNTTTSHLVKRIR